MDSVDAVADGRQPDEGTTPHTHRSALHRSFEPPLFKEQLCAGVPNLESEVEGEEEGSATAEEQRKGDEVARWEVEEEKGLED